jgi:integrase/recombinase XerD
LFQSKTGKPLAQQNVDSLLQAIANQANARLPKDDHISLSPHVLRHTALRKWTQKKGVQFAQKIAGHASDRYIWRYVTPSDAEVQQAADDLWT